MRWRDSRRYLVPLAVAAVLQVAVFAVAASVRFTPDACAQRAGPECYEADGCAVLCTKPLVCFCGPDTAPSTGPSDWTMLLVTGTLLVLGVAATLELCGPPARIRYDAL